MKISACVIAKNEAENIPRWLKSAKGFADEMIVVDTGSSDETASLAEKGGAKVYSFAWQDDFSAAKNFALDQATGDWVVFTDADEYFTEESVSRVRPLIEEYDAADKFDGFIVQLINLDMDTGAFLGTQAMVQRIFRRAPWLRFVGSIHEHVENLSGDLGRQMMIAPGLTLYHTGYSPRVIREKAARNLNFMLARRAEGKEDILDAYHLMDCYYTLQDYPKAAQYAREAMRCEKQPAGAEDRPYAILLQALILMQAPDDEVAKAYRAACTAFPKKADFPLIYGVYAWDKGDFQTAWEADRAGTHLHEEYYHEGDFSLLLAPGAYAHLGELAALRGEMEAAVDFFQKSLQGSKYQSAVLSALFRVLHQMGADDALLISFLNGLYQHGLDAPFLLGVLMGSPFPRACLYYEKHSEKKCTPRRRALLAGDARAAAASLVEDIERSAALAMAHGGGFSQDIQGALVLLLPRRYHEGEETLQLIRMQRRCMHIIQKG